MSAGFRHEPVLLAEVLWALQPKDSGRYVDGTLGGGRHAEAILDASAPGGWLFGCDRDQQALAAATHRLARFTGRFVLRHGNFSQMAEWLERGSCDGVLLDLGVSSWQLDRPERGFSFQETGPLDMRMDQSQAESAETLVNEASSAELAKIFWDYGEEPRARRLARVITEARQQQRFTTTRQLAELIERVLPRGGKKTHPATRVFQALRIAVNDELGALREGLAAAMTVLRGEGRLAVISFHSLEDRVVKEFGRQRARDYTYEGEVDLPELRVPQEPTLRLITRKPVEAGPDEVARNPRSRSARLRVFEKI